MIKSDIYAAITEKVIANLERCGSWQQMWRTISPISLNGYVYRGINRLMLSNDQYQSQVYGTFQQVRSNGGMVRKGEKSSLVVFWKRLQSTDPISLETKTRYMPKQLTLSLSTPSPRNPSDQFILDIAFRDHLVREFVELFPGVDGNDQGGSLFNGQFCEVHGTVNGVGETSKVKLAVNHNAIIVLT